MSSALNWLVHAQHGDQIDATVAVPFRIDQQRTRRVGDVFATRRARFERVALHLRVVVQHEAGVLLIEVAPVVTRAEHREVVVAHAVGDGLAVVLLQERQHRRIRRVDARMAGRIEQLRLDLEVLQIRRRRIVRDHARQLRCARRVVIAGGFAQLDEDLVVVGELRKGDGLDGGGRAARDECRSGKRQTGRAIYSVKAF